MLKKIQAHVLDNKSFNTLPDFNIEALKDLIASNQYFWIEIPKLVTKVDIADVFKELHIHHLILEDLFNPNQRAKIEIFDHQVFCVLGLMQYNENNRINLQTLKLNMILSERFLITFNTSVPDSLQKLNYQLLSDSLSKSNHPKIDFIAYLIIEQMMNGFYTVIDNITESLEALEDLLIESPIKVQLQDIYLLKRKILFLRKVIPSYCDIAEIFYQGDISYIHKEHQIYFMNLYEQSSRTLQSLDFYQMMISNMYDIYLSSISNYSNQSINTITRFATIFIPLSFISSFYGMNLIMPEIKYSITYPIVLTVMAITATSMYFFILRKKIKKKQVKQK
ncbi:MAG: hypothetical protein EBY16_06790 [Gammaproteobacteria bacterium]|nr:hypothetical protein [Gammaproteobacteria bacterium]